MYTENIVEELKKKYGTNDPFELAKYLNIIVLYEELGEIKGYYNKYVRQKFIHLNTNLNEYERSFTCGHELGHAVMHPNSNTPFLRENTLFSVERLEIDANQFSVDLIIDTDKIKELLEERFYTIEQVSNYFGIDKKIIEYKIKRMYKNRFNF